MFDFNRNNIISRVKYVLLSKLRLVTISIAVHEGRHCWPACRNLGAWAMAALPGVSTGSGMRKCRLAALHQKPTLMPLDLRVYA